MKRILFNCYFFIAVITCAFSITGYEIINNVDVSELFSEQKS